MELNSVTFSFLVSLPVRITSGALPRGLHVLNLSKNNISTIEGLRELTRLRVLDLSYNRILRIGRGKANSRLPLKFLNFCRSYVLSRYLLTFKF